MVIKLNGAQISYNFDEQILFQSNRRISIHPHLIQGCFYSSADKHISFHPVTKL